MNIEIKPWNKPLQPDSKSSLTITLYVFTFIRCRSATAVGGQIVTYESGTYVFSMVHRVSVQVSLGDYLDFKSSHPEANTSNFARCWSVI